MPKPATLRAALKELSKTEAALEVVCYVLKGSRGFETCADLARALFEACDVLEVSDDARKSIENGIGIGFRK
jgi:hypothetical protein